MNITENIKGLGERNTGCGVFDTVDHQVLLAKFDHYRIHGVSNDLNGF